MKLTRLVPFLNKTKAANTNIKQYCESTKIRYEESNSFTTKRQFLVDYIEQITYWNDKIAVHGSIPIKTGKRDEVEDDASRLEFCIER